MDKRIEHEGIVVDISDNKLTIRILALPACGGCVAKSHCMPSESKEIDICVDHYSGAYQLGERVMVVMQQSLGFKALGIGYLLPFVIMMVCLLVVYQLTDNELASGLAALLILIPYYIVVKLVLHKKSDIFDFQVKKMN
jgi:sigma-E factor negative regulatory protein RseC